ncbi:hypothetical protein EV187_2895 [Agromyces ramosus]|uniref:Uncharacterized protein n=1 Tax=Agromyces ramosus TaxID=33879 RepID=A0A4Q7MCB5_9MICO|nr:hypothetical protein [Agromyces ramosus]RZS64508.1 hypothetical protein EV187_2895 [Agromyces ramosus]
MERPIVAALRQVIVDRADAGTGAAAGSEAFGSSATGGLGTIVLPVFAIAAALTAAVCVGSLLVEWLRKPEVGTPLAVTDPESAGLLSVGFVSGSASARWLPATVMLLAAGGVIAIQDRRAVGDSEAERPQDVHLVFDGDHLLSVGWDEESRDSADDTVLAMLSPEIAGGALTVGRGASVDADRVVRDNERLRALTQRGFRDAAAWYREPRPERRFRAATIAGVLGVVLGFLTLALLDDAATSIAWSAIGIGALSLGLRVILPRWIPLNADGLQLRERANEWREVVAGTDVANVAAGERLLPWAVLFDEASVIRRFAELAEESGAAPAWYRSLVPFSAARLASCITLVATELSQPVRVGGGLLRRSEDSRFGVPMIGDTKVWGGAYFAGDGGGPGSGGGGDGGGGGGGFDGGGIGGFDGGGGGDGGGF